MADELYAALFSIVDAELNSDKVVHDYFNELKDRYKKYDGLFAKYLLPKIRSIGIRDGFRDSMEFFNTDCIKMAHELSETWVKIRGKDE